MKVERVCRHRKSDGHEVVVLTGNKKCITKKGEFTVGDEVTFTEGKEIIEGLRSAGRLSKTDKFNGTSAVGAKKLVGKDIHPVIAKEGEDETPLSLSEVNEELEKAGLGPSVKTSIPEGTERNMRGSKI